MEVDGLNVKVLPDKQQQILNIFDFLDSQAI